MNHSQVGRRSMLVGAGALAVAAATLPATAASAAAASDADHGLAGAWLITRRDRGAPSSVKGIATFADGGAFATVDINPESKAAIGAWVSGGDHIEGTYDVSVNAGGQHDHSSGAFHGTRIEP